jgi:hypothetical protein
MNAPVRLSPNPGMYVSPEMVAEMALGKDTEHDIAARYGLARFECDWLTAQSWFAEMVARKRQELHENGDLFSAKAAMMAEELWVRLYQSALTGGLPNNLIMDAAKSLTEIGRLMPPKGGPAVQQGGGGPAFQININLTGDAQGPGRVKAEVIEATPVTVSIPKDDLPPKPAGFRVPDFKLTPDLIGSPVAQNAAVAQTPQVR